MITAAQLLIAPPAMTDPRFRGTVIFMIESSHMGSWGLVVNRDLGSTAHSLLAHTDICCDLPWPVYWGGPQAPGVIWLLHDQGWSMSNTLAVGSELAITSHPEMFDVLAQGHCPRHSRIIAGTAAWRPGQLESEIAAQAPRTSDHSWLYSQVPSAEWLLEHSTDQLWTAAVAQAGQEAVHSWIT